MRRFITYSLLFFSLGLAANVFAQDCGMNMLSVPNASSYAVIPTPRSISLPGAFTIEFWAQSTSFAAHSGLVEQIKKGDTGSFSIGFTSGDSLIVSLHFNNGITNLTTSNITNIQKWNHYAVTFTPGDSIRIYINGVLKASQKTNAAKLIASTDSILIAHSNLSGVTFTGNIDELRIWSIARTAAEILASWKTTLTGKEAGLRAYYSFDDDSTKFTIHDFTGGNNEGKLVSSAVLDSSTSPVTGTTASYMLASKELSVIFPDLICATTTDTIIHVFNRGASEVLIDPVSFESGKIFSATTAGFPLPPDSTHIGIISIHASPSKPGFYRDTLIVPSTTVCGGVLRIAVELRVQKISIAFQDSVFKLGNLLPCELPLILPGQTTLYNTGTKAVTISSLEFSVPAGIKIISPIVPFTIDSGKNTPIIFTVLPGASGPINSTLTVTTKECSFSTKITFQGKRIIPAFSIPDNISFSTIHLPPTSIAINRTIFLKNTGTSDLSMNPALALLGGPGFRLISPSSGIAVIRPDSSLAITIRFTTSECGTFEAALRFQDQINCSIDTLIPISITVLGPEVSPGSDIFDLGASCGAHDTVVTFVNKSGRTVVLGKPVFTKDNVFSILSGTLPKYLSPGDTVSLTIHFAPTDPGRYSMNARFPLSPCGDVNITLQGLLGIGQIALSDSSLDFGNGCDTITEIRKLTITNLCGREISIADTNIEGSKNFSIINPPLPFKMENNEFKEITVLYAPKQLGSLEQARISLYDSGCFVTRFSVQGVRERANIPTSLTEFGIVCPGTTATLTARLLNLGYGNDTISSYRFIGAPVFSVPNIGGTIIKHGAVIPISVSFSPKDTGEFLGLLEIHLAPCGDITSITVHGRGGPAAVLSITDSNLNFGTMKFGTTDSLCTILQNPSCIPLIISSDSIRGKAISAFKISENSRLSLPDSLIASEPLTLCFIFSPDSIGSFETFDTIKIGDQKKIVRLHGAAGISDLTFTPRVFDFGDVLKGKSKSLQLTGSNKGSFPSTPVIVSKAAQDFSIVPLSQTIGGMTSVTYQIIFSPSKLGLQDTVIVFSWDNHFDTIRLRGRGIQPGLQLSASLLDFTQVRVAHDSVISITATNSLSSENIVIDTVSVTGKFAVSPNASATVNPDGKLSYVITYSPDAETVDTGTLTFHTENSKNSTLSLRGEGVDAHLVVSTIRINFGNVGLGQTQNYLLKISDTGGYPLEITGFQNNVSNFSASPISPLIIPPKSTIFETVNFTPQRAISYLDTLHIDADAPEKTASILLQGKGVFAPLGIPQVSYSIPDRQAKVGDIIDIPISMDGKDLPFFDLDSFRVELSYDPNIVFFHDSITTLGTLSLGFKMKFERLAHDSIIRITGSGYSIIPFANRLFILQAEALLGPVDSTRIFVLSSNPINTANLLSSSGLFVVTDCGNYRGGVISKGNYSVSNVSPNPASTAAHIDYEIGLPGRVHLDIYDALGRHIRTITDDSQTKGKHTARFSTEGIPSGEYIYVLKSLEYENRGTMIILN